MKNIFLLFFALASSAFAKDIPQNSPHNSQHLGYTEIKIGDGIFEIHIGASRLFFSSKPSREG